MVVCELLLRASTNRNQTFTAVERCTTSRSKGIGVHKYFGSRAFVNCLQRLCKQLTKAIEPKHPANPSCLFEAAVFLNNFLFEVTVVTGPNNSEDVFLPLIPLIPSDANLPFDFKQLQFPLQVCFACNVDPSTKPKANIDLKVAGLYLQAPYFSQGQFYVYMWVAQELARPATFLLYMHQEVRLGMTKGIIEHKHSSHLNIRQDVSIRESSSAVTKLCKVRL